MSPSKRRKMCYAVLLLWPAALSHTVALGKSSGADHKAVGELLAPVQALTNITSKGPESLSFEATGKESFRLSGRLPDKKATVNLTPTSGVWDVSRYSYVRIDFVNNGPGLVWIRGRLDNKDALDWADSTPSQAFVMPGERATLGFPFPRAKELNDAPPIFDQQSGKPNGHREHWKEFDPARVVACRLIIESTSSELVLDDLVVSLAYPYGVEANAAQLELPYLDEFGQVRMVDWPGKVHDEEEFKQRHEAEAAKGGEGPRSFNRFGGWADGPQLRSTGFFRVEKVDGQWWLVDPDGRLFFSHGANSVGFDQKTPIAEREALFAWLPETGDAPGGAIKNGRMHFTIANLARTFGPSWQQPARERVHHRLRQWGLNTIGAWSDEGLIGDKRTPYTPILHASWDDSPLGKKISDPFAPTFKESVVKGLKRLVDPRDPWCVGVFIDNEMYWTEPFVQNAFLRGPKQPARDACIDWLKGKHGTIEKLNQAWGTSFAGWDDIGALPENETKEMREDITGLQRLIAGTYYRVCREAMREALPNHLYLGSRQHKAPGVVLEEAAKYVDVLSLNSYHPLSGAMVPSGVDVPCMDTEFHFGAPDRGVPGVGLWPVGDQTQRSRSYVAYVLSGVKHPKIVGTHWFAFADQSAAGRPGENYQIGFVDVTDTPYPEITAASRVLAERMYEIGAGGKQSTLLESLEALWGGQGAAPGNGTISYRIENGADVTVAPDGQWRKVGSEGPFRLVLKPVNGDAWDMENIRVLGLEVKNTGATDLVLDVMARNPGATTFSRSALGRTVIKAGEELPLGVAFQRLADYRTSHPAYLRMSGRPNGHFRHWHTFDPGNVQDLLITCSTPGRHSFQLGPMFALQETNEALADALPILDRFGQYMIRDWPGKASSDDGIKALERVEDDLIEEIGEASGFNRFGGWADGPQLEATGFFRTEKVDGKWWFVDPEGRLFWSFGANCIGIDFAGQTPTERDQRVFAELPVEDDPAFGRFHVKLEVEDSFLAKPDVPHYDFTRANLFRKYGRGWESRQVERDIKRLKYTHLNTIGAWSDNAIIERRQVPYVAMLHYVYPEAAPKLPDPFNPATRQSLRRALRAYPVEFANDPWCLGAFVDNELHWKNDARQMIAAIFGHTTTGSEARKTFINWLRDKYGDVAAFNEAWKTGFKAWEDLLATKDPGLFADADAADCSSLATLFADAQFRMVREELTAYSPKVMYLGCRMNAGSPEVIAALARHADVISANIYSYRPELKGYGATDKPVLISEFHFANVSGNNLGGGLRSAQDAVQQGRLLEEFMAEAVKDAKLVGAHWFQWRDQSAAGRYDGENYDVGLYDVVDGPKPELVRAMAECGKNLYSHGQ